MGCGESLSHQVRSRSQNHSRRRLPRGVPFGGQRGEQQIHQGHAMACSTRTDYRSVKLPPSSGWGVWSGGSEPTSEAEGAGPGGGEGATAGNAAGRGCGEGEGRGGGGGEAEASARETDESLASAAAASEGGEHAEGAAAEGRIGARSAGPPDEATLEAGICIPAPGRHGPPCAGGEGAGTKDAGDGGGGKKAAATGPNGPPSQGSAAGRAAAADDKGGKAWGGKGG
eukprot:gene5621-biopygen12202